MQGFSLNPASLKTSCNQKNAINSKKKLETMKKNKILNFYWFNFFKSSGYICLGGDNVVPSS